MGYFSFCCRQSREEDSTGNMARTRRKQASFCNVLFLIVSFVFIEFEYSSLLEQKWTIVDHDLENEETQITDSDTPGKYLVWKVHHSVELCFKVLAVAGTSAKV